LFDFVVQLVVQHKSKQIRSKSTTNSQQVDNINKSYNKLYNNPQQNQMSGDWTLEWKLLPGITLLISNAVICAIRNSTWQFFLQIWNFQHDADAACRLCYAKYQWRPDIDGSTDGPSDGRTDWQTDRQTANGNVSEGYFTNKTMRVRLYMTDTRRRWVESMCGPVVNLCLGLQVDWKKSRPLFWLLSYLKLYKSRCINFC